jgi:hypothetical protein
MRFWASRALLAAAAVALPLGACGGSDPPARAQRERPPYPQGREDPQAAGRDLARAVKANDCARFSARLGDLRGVAGQAECRRLRKIGVFATLERWEGRVKRYGTAAVGKAHTYTETDYVMLALQRDGRWHYRTLTGTPIGGVPSAGDARRTIDHGVDALARGDCGALRLVFAPAREHENVCRREEVRELRRIAKRRLRVHAFGGNEAALFFGVGASSGEFFTITLLPTDGVWLWADVARSDPRD